jgi:hypothetical protein
VRTGLFFLAGLAVLAALPPAAARSESPALGHLREVEKLLSGQSSVSGRFTLEKRFDHLDEPGRAEGWFFFARPDFLIWEQSAPNWSRLELENGRIQVWNGSPEAPVRPPAARAEAAGQAARALLGWLEFDPQALAAGYEVFLERPEPLTLMARPRRPGARKYLESIQIEFASDRPVVRRVVLNERDSRTFLIFDRVLLNQPRPELGHDRLAH